MSEIVYFVTGTSRGIGYEFVKQLVLVPNTVVFAGVRRRESLDGTFDPVPSNLFVLKCDVTSEEDVTHCVEVVRNKFNRVDVLINNAGVDNYVPLRKATPDQFRWVLETNLVSVLRVTNAFLPLVQRSEVKKVICISSDFGSIALNDRKEFGPYNVSKAGLNMLVVQYRNECAEERITFVALHPGWVWPREETYAGGDGHDCRVECHGGYHSGTKRYGNVELNR
jgi:NAD(P)-dependent dehydrogenase (short-subunit alcohol dehydrogenase family)